MTKVHLQQAIDQLMEQKKEECGLVIDDRNDGLPKFQKNLVQSIYRLEAQITANLLLIRNATNDARNELRLMRAELRTLAQGAAILLSLAIIGSAVILCAAAWLLR